MIARLALVLGDTLGEVSFLRLALPSLLLVACAAAQSDRRAAPAATEPKPQAPIAASKEVQPPAALPSECNFESDEEQASIICVGDQPQPVNLAVLGKLGRVEVLTLVNVKLDDLTTLPKLEVHQFGIQGGGVADLRGIGRLDGLKAFGVYAPSAPKLDALETTSVEDLTLPVTATTDLISLTRIHALADLTLDVVEGQEAPNLAGLTQIWALAISGQSVTSLETISGLAQLEILEVSSSELEDLRPLAGLTSLRHLRVDSSKVSDLKPLAGLSRLEELSVAMTRVTDLSPLHKLANLKSLSIVNSPVTKLKVAAFRKARPGCFVDGP